MDIKRHLLQQRGAALLIILVVIVLFGIAAPALIDVTLYSRDTIANNTERHEEFYRAEGAINLVLGEMGNTDAERYAYLQNYVDKELPANGNPYLIGDVSMSVTIAATKEQAGGVETIHATLTARNVNESKIQRQLTVLASKRTSTGTVTRRIPVYGSGKVLNFVVDTPPNNAPNSTIYESANINIPNAEIRRIPGTDFTSLYNYFTTSANKLPIINNPNFVRMQSGIYGNISPSGNTAVIIPTGSIVIMNELRLRGGNYVRVDGVLIVKTIDTNGNNSFQINSGIITENIKRGSSNNWIIEGLGQGINCEYFQGVPGFLEKKCILESYKEVLEEGETRIEYNFTQDEYRTIR